MTPPVLTPARAPTPPPEATPPSAPTGKVLTLEEELQEAIRRAQVRWSYGQERMDAADPDPGPSARFMPLLLVRSCFQTGASMTSWRIRWNRRVRAELRGLSGRGDEILSFLLKGWVWVPASWEGVGGGRNRSQM